MLRLVNVSSPVSTANSDIDFNLYLSPVLFSLTVRSLSFLHIGRFVRSPAYVVEVGKLELFLVNSSHIDQVTLAVENNARIQRLWSPSERERFFLEKAKISHLTGSQRKRAKFDLALQFGLNPEPYRG